MNAFTNLNDALRAMKTDPSTARDPIKRMFLCDGQFITANASIIEESGNALHTQPSHDEIVLILGGEADFRVGEETSHVSAGDMIFIPRNTLHGPIIPKDGEPRGAIDLRAVLRPVQEEHNLGQRSGACRQLTRRLERTIRLHYHKSA